MISSSTSGYGMSEMQDKCTHPDRTVVGHPFNPPYLIPLVEVVGGTSTVSGGRGVDRRLLPARRQVGHHDGPRGPGFVANRLQEALWREALHMVEAG